MITSKEELVLSRILDNILSKRVFSVGSQRVNNFQQMALKPNNIFWSYSMKKLSPLHVFPLFSQFLHHFYATQGNPAFNMHLNASLVVFTLLWTVPIPTTIYPFWIEQSKHSVLIKMIVPQTGKKRLYSVLFSPECQLILFSSKKNRLQQKIHYKSSPVLHTQIHFGWQFCVY